MSTQQYQGGPYHSSVNAQFGGYTPQHLNSVNQGVQGGRTLPEHVFQGNIAQPGYGSVHLPTHNGPN